jgi:hypothetical protein
MKTFRNKLSLYVCVIWMRLVRCQYNEYKYKYSTDFVEIWFWLARLEGERCRVLVAVNIKNGTSGMWSRVVYWWYQTLRRNLLTASTGETVGPSEILLIIWRHNSENHRMICCAKVGTWLGYATSIERNARVSSLHGSESFQFVIHPSK